VSSAPALRSAETIPARWRDQGRQTNAAGGLQAFQALIEQWIDPAVPALRRLRTVPDARLRLGADHRQRLLCRRLYSHRPVFGRRRHLVSTARRHLAGSADRTLADHLQAEAGGFARYAATLVFSEGVCAFLGRRKPSLPGRQAIPPAGRSFAVSIARCHGHRVTQRISVMSSGGGAHVVSGCGQLARTEWANDPEARRPAQYRARKATQWTRHD